MKTNTTLSLVFLAASFAVAQAPMRPEAPSPAPIRRPMMPNAAPGGPGGAGAQSGRNQAKPVTQPGKSGGDQPIIPYDENDNALNFQDASADLVIMEYALRTGRTVIKAPNVPQVNITLRTTPDNPLDDEQYLVAIETVLNLNGIALEKVGDKFIKVLPFSELPKTGKPINYADENGEVKTEKDGGQFVSAMIELKFIDISEVQPIVSGLARTGAQIQTIERTNSILITDSADNVNRIVELIKRIDKPIVAREESNIRQINYAKAADIKARLDEIVERSQEEENTTKKNNGNVAQNRQSGPPGAERRQLPPGVSFRSRDRDEQPSGPTTELINSQIADVQRGMLRGKVSIIADERTNMLIILTRPENMVTLDKFIEALDKPTAPDYLVEVIRLEHGVAEDMASLLNDLIDKQKANDNDADPAVRGNGGDKSKSASGKPGKGDSKTSVGQLNSENISILADDRTNSLVVMAPAADMDSLRSIITQMDIQLSQVVIETVIVQVTFEDSQETGMDWVQRAMLSGRTTSEEGPRMAFATAGGGGSGRPQVTTSLTSTDSLTSLSAGGVTGWFTLFDLNMDLILKAIKTDTRSHLMSSPRITTMDNKEATLESTDRIYWSEGSTHYTSSDYYSDNIKNEDIGIKLTVTPRINKNGYITLTMEQEVQSSPGTTRITTNDRVSEFPLLSTRKMGADVAVQSGETVVLGGLADNSITKVTSRVPILGSIPLLGWFFRNEKDVNKRTEIIVFLTPRVVDTAQQMEDDARKIKASLDTRGIFDSGWSGSRIADPIPQSRAREILENGRKTVAPPRYPLTGYLTGLNDENSLSQEPDATMIREEMSEAEYDRRLPYIHYSDIDAARRVQDASFYCEELEAPEDGAEPETSDAEETDAVSEAAEAVESEVVEESAAVVEDAPAADDAPAAGDSEDK